MHAYYIRALINGRELMFKTDVIQYEIALEMIKDLPGYQMKETKDKHEDLGVSVRYITHCLDGIDVCQERILRDLTA